MNVVGNNHPFQTGKKSQRKIVLLAQKVRVEVRKKEKFH